MTSPNTLQADDGTPVYAKRAVTRWRNGELQDIEDAIAEEVPVAMVYNGVTFAVMMATPSDLDDFALGFSLSEGLIAAPSQLLSVQVHQLLEGVELAMQVTEDAPAADLSTRIQRWLPGRGGCGICGTRELENAVRQPTTIHSDMRLSAGAMQRAFAQLPSFQPITNATGAVHAAAWADIDGNILLAREDVGRHNALDKLIGALHRATLSPDRGMALITSRASYEMVIKAASARFGLLAAISAPTALAIDLARSTGLTLVGFVRPGGYNVYTHAERLAPRA